MNAIYPLLLPFGKFILTSVILIGFYLLLYKRNASYNHSRLYLLALPLIAALASWITIEVYTPPPRTVEIEPPPTFVEKAVFPLGNQYNDHTVNPEEKKSVSFFQKSLAELNWKKGFFWGYLCLTGLLLMYPLWGTLRILQFKRGSVRDSYRGISVIRSSKIQTPFSLFKTIYLSGKLRDSQLQMILEHERWHILHKHYIDVMWIEIFTRVFWFNPLLWWVRHELRNLHEYQADRSVLDHGLNLYEYQTTLLEEVMNTSSCLANGFNQSFIKQRFIAMKKKQPIRFETLRNIIVIPFMLLLLVLFTFTRGEAKIIYVQKVDETSLKTTPNLAMEWTDENLLPQEEFAENQKESPELEEPVPFLSTEDKVQETILTNDEKPSVFIPEEPERETVLTIHQTTKIEKLTEEDNLELMELTNRPDYPQISKVSLSSVIFTSDIAECPIYIERNEQSTRVTRVFPILSDWEQICFPDKNKIMLIDSRTGDRYLLRELHGDYPLGTPFYIRRHQKQMVQFTFIYPPLPSSVKTIDIIDGTNVYGLKIKEHIKKKIKVIR